MPWSDEFSTGIHWLDTHHRRLFAFAADYREALDAGQGQRTYGALLDALTMYTAAHFRAEEHCMERHRCPAARDNVSAHTRFSAALEQYRAHYAERGFTPADARNLVDMLDRWLERHIGRVDVQLQGCVHKRRGVE